VNAQKVTCTTGLEDRIAKASPQAQRHIRAIAAALKQDGASSMTGTHPNVDEAWNNCTAELAGLKNWEYLAIVDMARDLSKVSP
jgi:hypothetical protein